MAHAARHRRHNLLNTKMIYVLILAGGDLELTQPTFWLKWWDQNEQITFLIFPAERLKPIRTKFQEIFGPHDDMFEKHWKGLNSDIKPEWGTHQLASMTFLMLQEAFKHSARRSLRARETNNSTDMFYYVSENSIPIASCQEIINAKRVNILGGEGITPNPDYNQIRKACRNLWGGTATIPEFTDLMLRLKNQQWICCTQQALEKLFSKKGLGHSLSLAATLWMVMQQYDKIHHVKYPDEFFPSLLFACAGVRWDEGATIMAEYRPTNPAFSPVAFGGDDETVQAGGAVVKSSPTIYFQKDYYKINLNAAIFLSCALRYYKPARYSHQFFFRKVTAEADLSDWGEPESFGYVNNFLWHHAKNFSDVKSLTQYLVRYFPEKNVKGFEIQKLPGPDPKTSFENDKRGFKGDTKSRRRNERAHELSKLSFSRRTQENTLDKLDRKKKRTSEHKAVRKKINEIWGGDLSTDKQKEKKRHLDLLKHAPLRELIQTSQKFQKLKGLVHGDGDDSDGGNSQDSASTVSTTPSLDEERNAKIKEMLTHVEHTLPSLSSQSSDSSLTTESLKEHNIRHGSWRNRQIKGGPKEPNKGSKREFDKMNEAAVDHHRRKRFANLLANPPVDDSDREKRFKKLVANPPSSDSDSDADLLE